MRTDDKALETAGPDGCTKRMYLMSLNDTLTMAKTGSFRLRIFATIF